MIRLSALLLTLTALSYCRPDDPEPQVAFNREDTLTIAGLRAFHERLLPATVRITDSGKEGQFRIDLADQTSADNTGTTLVTANGRRYKRVFSGPATLAWFGVRPSDTDIGPKLQAAVDAADEVFIPDGTYTQLTTVRLRSNLIIRANPGQVTLTLPATYVSLANAIDPSIPLNNVRIDGLSWRVTSQERGVFGTIYIDSPSVTKLTIQNCSSTDAAAKDSTNWLTLKIPAGKTAADITVRNNRVEAKRMGCEIFNHDNHGVYAGRGITVSDNTFYNCHFGISLSGPMEDLTVTNNLVKDCSFYGIEIAGAARNVTIVGNRFEGTFGRLFAGSNDGGGNGSLTGGMVITDNRTVGNCRGGIQLFNGGAAQFSRNTFVMTGMLELAHGTAGGRFTDNVIETTADKAIICDNSPNNTFSGNRISNRNSPANHATFMAYGPRATNNVLTNNVLIKGTGGLYHEAVLGGSYRADKNYDEAGNPLP